MGLVHVPRLLFLDEPSTGLDPQSRANLWEHIRSLRDEHGTTVFLTTHYLDEADALCDRILVIDHGRIVAEGTPDALKRRVSGDLVLVGSGEPGRVAAIAERLGQVSELVVDGALRALPRPRWRRRAPGPAPRARRGGHRDDVGRGAPPEPRRRVPDLDRPHVARRRAEGLGMTTLVQIWLIFQRAMRQSLRNPVWVIIGIVQPVLYLTLFGPLLQPLVAATPGFPPGDAYQVLVPALLVQLGMFGSLFAGFSLIQEYRTGVVERMRVTPASRTALLLGRSMRDVVVLVVQGILLTLVAMLFGLRAPPLGIAVALVLVAVVAVATSAASYAMALLVKSEEALGPLLNAIVVPLLLLSGILLPMTLAPAWLFALSRLNPFAYVVDAERAAFQGAVVSGTVGLGLAVAVGVAALTVAWGVRTFHRESA